MTASKLQGVIAAIATAVDDKGEPDCARSTALASFLLANGCDGLNVLGTTGEATSFSLEQRKRVMSAYRAAGLPLDRLMVGTGAASVADAIALTRHAAELGFAGALVLPPFYYKGVPDDGLFAYVELIVQAIEKAGYKPGNDVCLALDPAASEFFKKGKYVYEGEGSRAHSALSLSFPRPIRVAVARQAGRAPGRDFRRAYRRTEGFVG